MLPALPPIPDKRYFTISEVADLCLLKPHVLRFWEQEFKQLRPRQRDNRRYYTREDIDIVRQIRDLLYGQLFTIKGAKVVLEGASATQMAPSGNDPSLALTQTMPFTEDPITQSEVVAPSASTTMDLGWLRQELHHTMSLLQETESSTTLPSTKNHPDD